MQQVIRNGELLPFSAVHFNPGNRSFKFGDGCFETLKVVKGQIVSAPYHFSRLLYSLEKLYFNIPSYFNGVYLQQQVALLTSANQHQLARVRLTCYREGGTWYEPDNSLHWLLQSEKLETSVNHFNEKGLHVGLFAECKKSIDDFSMLKTNNYLPYVVARLWANKNKYDDAILFNCNNNIADSSIANIFIVSDGMISTPSLTQGGIDGTCRKYLLNCLRKEGMPFQETIIGIEQLMNASEVFFTNAVSGIRWVKKINESNFSCDMSRFLHKKFIAPLYDGL